MKKQGIRKLLSVFVCTALICSNVSMTALADEMHARAEGAAPTAETDAAALDFAAEAAPDVQDWEEEAEAAPGVQDWEEEAEAEVMPYDGLWASDLEEPVYGAPPALYVTFDKGDDGASGSMEAIRSYGGYCSLPECGFTPPEGKAFFMWQVGDEPQSLYKPGDSIEFSEDVTVTALYHAADGYLVWIGETEITPANAEDVTGDGTISYDSGTGTLVCACAEPAISGTMREALIYTEADSLTIEAPSGLELQSDTAAYAIRSIGSVSINGDVTAVMTEGSGILSERGDIIISGNADMTTKNYCLRTDYEAGGAIRLGADAHLASTEGSAIDNARGVTIEGDAELAADGAYLVNSRDGIRIGGNVTGENKSGSGLFTASGNSKVIIEGDVDLKAEKDYVVFGLTGIEIGGDVRAESARATLLQCPNGSLSVTGNSTLTTYGNGAYLIYVTSGDITTGSVTGSAPNGTGILNGTGAININGDVNITSKSASLQCNVGDDLVITGDADLTATNGVAVVCCLNLRVGGDLIAKVNGNPAVYAQEGVVIEGSLAVTNPGGSGIKVSGKGIRVDGEVTMDTKAFCLSASTGGEGKVAIGGKAYLKSSDGKAVDQCFTLTVGGDAELYGNNSDNLVLCTCGMSVDGDLTGENVSGGGPYIPSQKLVVTGDVNMNAAGGYLLTGMNGIEIGGSVTGQNSAGGGLYSPMSPIIVGDYVDVTVNGEYLAYSNRSGIETGSVCASNTGGYGFYAPSGNITINGDAQISSKRHALFTAEENKISILGDADLMSTDANAVGLCYDLVIEGDLKATANGTAAVMALNTATIGGDVTAENSRADGDGFYMPEGMLTIPEGSSWHIKADRSAILALNGIVIPESSKITKPLNAAIGQYEVESLPDPLYAIFDGSEPAGEVIIEPDPANAITLKSVTVDFDGLIRIRYTCSIPEGVAAEDGAYLAFEKNGGNVTTTLLSDGTPSGEDTYFFFPVPAPEFADDVILRAYDGEGNPIRMRSMSGINYTEDGFAYSARTYAERMEESGSTETMKKLAHALFDYGTAAQIYFKYGDYTGLTSDEHVTNVNADDLAAYKITAYGTKPAGISGASIAAQFNYDNSLRITFKLDGTHAASDYAFYVDDAPARPEIKGGNAVLTVTQIAAPDLSKVHSFIVTAGSDVYTVYASVLSYALTSVKNGDEARANLGRAVYLYYKAADEYFG